MNHHDSYLSDKSGFLGANVTALPLTPQGVALRAEAKQKMRLLIDTRTSVMFGGAA